MRYLFYAVAIAVLSAPTATQSARYDVLVRNGRILDGSGNPWMRADVGIRAGRIASIGTLRDATADTVIDAGDRLVTPGFIDVHSHAAEGLGSSELRQARPILAQGVTTVVVNPDGGGPIDLQSQRQTYEKNGIGPNVALLIGHGSVRRAVMRDSQQRAPTDQELEEMRRHVRVAMEQGAFGLSSGLFYTPGSFSKTEEVIALAAVAGNYGGVYTSHIRDEGNYNVGVVAAVEEVIRIAEEGRLTGIVSHMKALGPDNWGLSKPAIASIDHARARGVSVFADQYPYDASSTSLRAALLPDGVQLPVRKPQTSEEAEYLKEREKVTAIIRENIRRRGGAASIRIASYRPDASKVGMTLEQIAAKEFGGKPDAAAFEMLSRGEASIVSFNMSEDDIRSIMMRPYTMASSDGGLVTAGSGQPHPRNNGAFARRLVTYVRDRNVVGIEFAIRSMTSLPATVFGMKARGVIREGAIADLAVFDLAAIRDRATYDDPHQVAEGMAWVLVNGVPVIANGKFTEALPGKVLSRTDR